MHGCWILLLAHGTHQIRQNLQSQGNVYCYYNNSPIDIIIKPLTQVTRLLCQGRLVDDRLINGYLWSINIINGYRCHINITLNGLVLKFIWRNTLKKKEITKYMITKYLIILVTTFMPVTLFFWNKIRRMSLYGSVSVSLLLCCRLFIRNI